ncbi:MAG: immunoglobulin-like domain-containing protein [Tunicatimonas sp.]|uniref:immunoglobulin-like domain-containing protein n=1 Tax=Tunicatimonas sp. TaxID=1940096 RepID=UPI003C75B78B
MLRLYIKLSLVLACSIGSCNQNPEKQLAKNSQKTSPNVDSALVNNQSHQDKADTLEDTVFMKVDRNTIKLSELDQPITLIITNNKYEEVMTGEHYTIEKLEKGEWKVIPDDRFFDDLGYISKKGSSIDFDIHLLTVGYRYEPGKYRITKGYSVKIEEYEYDDYEVHSEITIE